MKLKFIAAIMVLAYVSVCSGALTAGETEKQPVFLLCPKAAKYSAWSIYFLVDKNDHSKVLSMGIDKLNGKNSEDLQPDGYSKVLAAQTDPSTQREEVATLDASSFNGGQLEVKKDNALRVSVTQVPEGYQMALSMRISADGRFDIGGKEQGKRDVLLKYDKASKTWGACAKTLLDNKGTPVVNGECKPMSGITFRVTGTGIYVVVGVLDGEPVVLLDRSGTD